MTIDLPRQVYNDAEWRANPPFTMEALIVKWQRMTDKHNANVGYMTAAEIRNTPALTAEYWAKIQYDDMLWELEMFRRRNYSAVIGAYWLKEPPALDSQ